MEGLKKDLKFTEVKDATGWEILSDGGWVSVSKAMETVPYETWELRLENGMWLECADEHIVFSSSGEKFVRDLEPGECVSTDHGWQRVVSVKNTGEPQKMYDLETENHRFYSNGILSHNTTTYCCYCLHQVLFRPDTTIAIVSNKGASARAILARIKLAYENLDKYIQMGVKVWNFGNIELDNGSSIIATSTSSDALRGYSINVLVVDECAYIDNWENFWASIAPTISSGKTSSILLVSTYNGENHFYRMVEEAKENRNGFKFFQVDYWDVPGRDEAWAEQMKSQLGEENFKQEILNIPTTVQNSLINSKGMAFVKKSLREPVQESKTMRIYKQPEKDRDYFISVDPADIGNDYSAIVVFDITKIPYEVVAVVKNQTVTAIGVPDLVYEIGTLYNTCPVLIESNEMGRMILQILNHRLEYDNIVMTRRETDKRFSANMQSISPGLRQTAKTKALGCQRMKFFIENEKIIIPDSWIYDELLTFRHNGTTYTASPGKHDDCVMAIATFSYFTSTKSFRVQYPTDLEDESRQSMRDLFMEDLVSMPIFANDVNTKPTDEDMKWLLK
jgi:hypothetical protein